DVRGSAKDEEIRIDRQAGGAVEVAIYAQDRKTGKRAEAPYFDRTFLSEETSEIRLYTMGGADEIKVIGQVDKTILVRVIAPERSVEISDLSSEPSAIQTYTPLPDPPLKPPTDPNADLAEAALMNHYETFRDWGRDTLFFPQLSYDSDRGLVAGASHAAHVLRLPAGSLRRGAELRGG